MSLSPEAQAAIDALPAEDRDAVKALLEKSAASKNVDWRKVPEKEFRAELARLGVR